MYLENIENLVFEGGGIKGYVYISVLEKIIEYYPDFLKHIVS